MLHIYFEFSHTDFQASFSSIFSVLMAGIVCYALCRWIENLTLIDIRKFYILVKLVFFSNFKQSKVIQTLVNEYLLY